MTSMELIPRDGGWVLPVAGQRVTRVCIDNEAVRLLCHNMLEISIAEPFVLLTPDSRRYVLDPAGAAMSLAPFLGVMRQVVRAGTAFKDGRLELGFGDGSRINVPPGSHFEAWTLAGPGGPDGLKVVSVPGGDLAIWADRRGS
jgi:hypothetical protein